MSRFDIRSFNFITWNWKEDFVLDDVKKEIDYQVDVCGVNTITFSFAAIQEHCYSTEIDWNGEHMPKRDELILLIEYCKERMLKTIVKPMLNVRDGYWRAYIRFFDEDVPCEPKWKEWFKNYNEYLLSYARFCEENKVDMIIIGCELVGTDHREEEWRCLIKRVREVYKGLVTYNCDKYQEHNVKWWDALDYITSSGYYPLGTMGKELDRIEEVVNKYKLPFMFTEAGCPSVKGASRNPNDWTVSIDGIIDEEEQYKFYKELFEETSKRSFVKGFCLWDWPMKSPKFKENKLIRDYSMKFKRAEDMVIKYFKV